MGLIKGGFTRLVQTFIYFLCLCASAIGLGIFAYFLAVLADRNAFIKTQSKAVTGLTGSGVVYSLFAVVLTCCLGGTAFFGIIAIILDILFMGAFIAVAVLTRQGAYSCSGIVTTPLGTGFAYTTGAGFRNGAGDVVTYEVSQKTACRLNKAVFGASIAAAVLFFIAALFQILLIRSGKKEKRYGPSPANGYTSGSARRNFWQRKQKPDTAREAEMGTAGTAVGSGALAPPAQDIRPSYETGTTVGNTQIGDKLEDGAHSGYYVQPHGSGVNPYGPTTAANY